MFIPIPWEWTTECFRSDFGHNLRIEIYFLKSIKSIKVTFLILHHFPVVVLTLCLPVVTPRCVSPWLPLVASSSRRLKRARARVGGMTERTEKLSVLAQRSYVLSVIPPTRARAFEAPRAARDKWEPWGNTTGCYNGETQRENHNGKMMQNEKCHFYTL